MAAGNGVLQTMIQVSKFLSKSKGFDKVLSKLSVVSASQGKVTCELKVEEEHLNTRNTLHGGLTATIIDNVSTMAIMSAEKPPGVSLDMNISYLRAAHPGDILTIKADCSKAGKTLAFTSVDIFNKKDGKLVAQGRHTKFL